MQAESSENVTGGCVYGDVLETTVCADFRWQWLLGPITIFFTTTVFLAGAVARSIRRSDREPVWKSSLLPVLYAGAGSKLEASTHSLKEMEKAAKKDYITLVEAKNGKWLLSKNKLDAIDQERDQETVALLEMS